MPINVTNPSTTSLTIFDQPNGGGHSLSLTGLGRITLADFPLDPQNPGLGTWQGAVRSYLANDTYGSFRTARTRRHEYFGPNFDIVNAGAYAHASAELAITWVGWPQWIQSGSIVSFGQYAIPGAPDEPAFCWDVLPAHKDENGDPLVLLNRCASQPGSPSQKWEWQNGRIFHPATSLYVDKTGKVLFNNDFYPCLVVKQQTGNWSQQFNFDRQRKNWYDPSTRDVVTVVGGWPPRIGLFLSDQYPPDSDWDQAFVNYFYSSHGQWGLS
jgi:hypothetical protein